MYVRVTVVWEADGWVEVYIHIYIYIYIFIYIQTYITRSTGKQTEGSKFGAHNYMALHLVKRLAANRDACPTSNFSHRQCRGS